jgi:hypothetical protein
MNRDTELLIRRATPLVFGVFGHVDDPEGTRIVRVGGSGIFIAPFQTLTARHVCRDLFRTGSNRFDDLDTRTEGYFELPHSSALFQVCEPFGPAPRSAIWQVHRTWDPIVTDICYMEVSAEGGEAVGMQFQMPTRFFEWSLLPPPIGSHVAMLGFPKTEIKISGGLMNIGVSYVLQVGAVTDVYELKRDCGIYRFPCFRIDKPVDHGFSGGPVFWQDQLCGIVSGGSVDDGTYAASMWPLCLMNYAYPDQGELGHKRAFGDLFEDGVLRAADWPSIKHHISKQYDTLGRAYGSITSDGVA